MSLDHKKAMTSDKFVVQKKRIVRTVRVILRVVPRCSGSFREAGGPDKPQCTLETIGSTKKGAN